MASQIEDVAEEEDEDEDMGDEDCGEAEKWEGMSTGSASVVGSLR